VEGVGSGSLVLYQIYSRVIEGKDENLSERDSNPGYEVGVLTDEPRLSTKLF
jgi:hypothetical protein